MTDCAKITVVPGAEEGKGSCEGPRGLHGGGGGVRWSQKEGWGLEAEGRGGEGGGELAGLLGGTSGQGQPWEH